MEGGRIDILCPHSAEYEVDDVPEDGIIALSPTCRQGCPDLTLVGTEAGVGMRTWVGGVPVAK